MKALIQRVTSASVTVDKDVVGQIDSGLLVLLGVEKGDSENSAKALAEKVLRYRIFSDEQGRMNKSLVEVEGDLLVVSQFTLAAETKKGLRPSFSSSAEPKLAEHLYESFVLCAKDLFADGIVDGKVETGRFAADMKVALVNDGPVTFLLQN